MAAQPQTSAGYLALLERLQIEAVPNWHSSWVSTTKAARQLTIAPSLFGGSVEETYPPSYWPGDGLGNHLEFALKYDGVNLAILAAIFERIEAGELARYVSSKPTGKYARRIWYLYEFITGERLALADLKQGGYVDLLDPTEYYTIERPKQVSRQRINDNLLGSRAFCPIVRRTKALATFERSHLSKTCQETIARFTSDQLRRALSYLYTKETKSSFEIEKVQPSSSRVERFVALLQSAQTLDYCEKSRLIELQNNIVDARFRETDYRPTQNYIGESIGWRRERVHYAPPKPDDVHELMQGVIDAHRRMEAGNVEAVVHAAAISFGFVYVHPFDDANGRIHRFLIHNVLARRGFTPPGFVFPVSAVMLNRPAEYDAALEAFSRPLMALVDYSLDADGRMTVRNDVALWYRYIDMTAQAEALFKFIEQTIETELVAELDFLANYDRAKEAMQSIVDLPDRRIDLFIRFCLQNEGRLSAAKRASHFDSLTDDEVARLERAVRVAYSVE